MKNHLFDFIMLKSVLAAAKGLKLTLIHAPMSMIGGIRHINLCTGQSMDWHLLACDQSHHEYQTSSKISMLSAHTISHPSTMFARLHFQASIIWIIRTLIPLTNLYRLAILDSNTPFCIDDRHVKDWMIQSAGCTLQ